MNKSEIENCSEKDYAVERVRKDYKRKQNGERLADPTTV